MNGKGDIRRPPLVSRERVARNWAATFGKRPKPRPKPEKKDRKKGR